jgi:hypothetical protein
MIAQGVRENENIQVIFLLNNCTQLNALPPDFHYVFETYPVNYMETTVREQEKMKFPKSLL